MNFGEGAVIISYPDGWGCASEASFEAEYDIDNGAAKRTSVITCKKLFNIGEAIAQGNVKGVFKYESGIRIAFDAMIQGKGRLVIIGEVNNDFETILNKISQWQEQFKEN